MTSTPYVQQRAHFLDAHTIAWNPELAPDPSQCRWVLEVDGAPLGQLTYHGHTITEGQSLIRRHLADHLALTVSGISREHLEQALTCALEVVQYTSEIDGTDHETERTGIQIAGVLDDLYADQARAAADLGVRIGERGDVTLTVWAPTAKSVHLHLGAEGDAEILPMTRRADGCWSITGDSHWIDQEYLYEVEVFVPSTGRIERNLVTDPYSVGLTVRSERSVIVDLTDDQWMPQQWSATPAPRCERFSQHALYELHVRDFSSDDEQVPEELRGTYRAFAHPSAQGGAHLRSLAQAGLTAVHLLPINDIGSIEEDRSRQGVAHIAQGAGPASEDQQAAVTEVQDYDNFNWGYDPLHFLAPEGSYATEGNQRGGARTREVREMIGALHSMGLQVVLDKVYNHTFRHGQDDLSVLDRVVPGYYHRLCRRGKVENSTCCSNLATEHAMTEQLMVDAVVLWARHYKVDGFRFDLMGHHSRANMEKIRAALDALTVEKDGVEGSSIYLYGEGWNFGEVANNSRFYQAVQGQLDGTSIGTFNDRIRDAVHGGGPADADKRIEQGLGTGLAFLPNEWEQRPLEHQQADARHRMDIVRSAMAGNLRDFSFLTSTGDVRRGADLQMNGAAVAYGSHPDETVNYVDAHDNETLWDILAWKLPVDTDVRTRVRLTVLSLATVMLGQSPAFWHAGTDLLRSKSLDRDSYNSGDWFNRVDWSGTEHGWGRGLPPRDRNVEAWDLMRPLLSNDALRASPDDIAVARCMCLDLLRLRASSPLFTLGDPEAIMEKVSFPGSGPEATPGLMLMLVDDTVGTPRDPDREGILIALNFGTVAVREQVAVLAGQDGWKLSAIQQNGADERVRGATVDGDHLVVPPLTAAVFEKRR